MPRLVFLLLLTVLLLGGCSDDEVSHANDGGGEGPGADVGPPGDAGPPSDGPLSDAAPLDGPGPGSDAPVDGTQPDAAGPTCTNPVFQTSDPNGGWSNGGYYVHNNMWNCGSYACSETLYACAYDNWYVVANMNNSSGDGAVKSYPNVHKDYNNSPKISSFNTITSTFAATSPHVGIYNVAYDIWLNGVASPGCTEVMIWTENYNQVPGGSKAGAATLGGRTYDVYKTSSGGYIAFVPTAPFTSGSIDLLEIFNWIIAKGWIPASSTLGQIDFGVEIVSTGGSDATFTFTGFSITES